MSNLKEEIEEAKKKLDQLTIVHEMFPDTSIHKDRWDRERFVSCFVNSKCTKVDLLHACGCCSDSPLYAWPYLEVEETKIFASGVPFCIGEQWPEGGEQEYSGWEEKLRKAEISEEVINQIANFFLDNKPFTEEDDE